MLSWLAGSALASSFGGGGLLARIGANLAHDVGAFVDWLSRDIWRVTTLALAIFALVQHFSLIDARHDSARWQDQFTKEHKARAADQAAYRKAQADAQAKNEATVARDKAERERITHEFDNYQGELASLRARLAQLLRAKAAQGASGQSDLPNVSPAPSGPDGAARVSIPPSLYVRGAELELQLERLQQWVAEQVKVDPNK